MQQQAEAVEVVSQANEGVSQAQAVLSQAQAASYVKNAILDANKLRNFNNSGLPNRNWTGQRVERMLTIQSHIRRIWREPQRIQQAIKK